ncbi:MAG: hypothetical protein QM749_03845 [Aquabacterium sp.]
MAKTFAGTDGIVNLTELGSAAKTADIKFRKVGTSTWVTGPTMNATSIGGTVTPGWFQFTPSSISGLSAGDYEYIVTTKDSATNVLVKASGSFSFTATTATVGNSKLTGSANWTSTVHFQNLPQNAASVRVRYNPTGSSPGSVTEQALDPGAGAGSFDWVTFENVVLTPATTYPLDYDVQAFDAQGQLIYDSTGKVKVGAINELVANSTANAMPASGTVRFKPLVAQGAVPNTMKLYYRSASSTGSSAAYTGPVTVSVDAATGLFTFNVSSLLPSATATGQWDYYYEVYNVGNTKLTDSRQPTSTKPARLSLGTSASSTPQNVLLGVTSANQAAHTSQTVNAFGEVIEQVDALSRKTTLRYNSMGKMLEKIDPLVDVTGVDGVTLTNQTISTKYYYDLQGRLVGTKDARNNAYNTQLLLAAGDGQTIVSKEYHADGGIKRNFYDVFGDLRFVNDELSTGDADTTHRTSYEYDRAHHVVKVTHPKRVDWSVAGFDLFTYDELGNRIKHQTSSDGTTSGANFYTDTSEYDALGRTTRTNSAADRWIKYDYFYDASIKGVNGATVGGWKLTTTNKNTSYNVLVDYTEIFGRKSRHIDLSLRDFSYTYNAAGWLMNQSRTDVAGGQNIDYAYYEDGRIKSLTDNALNTYTLYKYDSVGNKTYEGYATKSGSSWNFYQQATITYDALNRVTSIVDPQYRIYYQYDEVGNRRHLTAYKSSSSTPTQNYWYEYDNMNRFIVTMGTLVNNRVDVGTSGDGVKVTYNAVGQRKTVYVARDGHSESYDYSNDGFLVNSYKNGSLISTRTADLLGRVTNYAQTGSDNHLYFYDKDGKVDHDTIGQTTTINYMLADGTLDWSNSVTNSNSVKTYYAYQWWDDAKQMAITTQQYNPNINKDQNKWKAGTSYFEYDVNGHAKSVEDVAGNRSLRYATNAQGLIMVRDEIANGTINKTQRFFYFDGSRVGEVGNDATAANVDYAQALANQPVDRKTAYKNWQPIATADFDQNYTPISPTYPGFTAAGYTAQGGESLQVVAQSVWGDASLWYLLADANGLTSTTPLVKGQVLVIPNKVTNVHNNSTTKAVYNAAEAMGDTSPTLPDPPPPPKPKKGCGGVGMVLMVVVAVVATVFTAGVATMGLAAAMNAGFGAVMAAGSAAMMGGTLGLAGAMAAGAAGSIASQLTGMATGNVQQFSWSGVAMGAIGGGAMAGAGSIIGNVGQSASTALQATAAISKAALASVIGQEVSRAAGLQHGKFSWTAVAAAGAGAAASFAASNLMPSNLGDSVLTATGGQILRGTASGIAAGWASSMARHDKAQWAPIAANAFGSALGDAVVGSIAHGERNQAQAKQDALNAQWFTLDPAGLGPDTPTLADLYPPFNPDAEPVGTSEKDWRKQQDQLKLGELVERKSTNELIKEARDLIKVISDHGAVGRPTRGVNSSGEIDASELYRQGLGNIRETVISVSGGSSAAEQAVEQSRVSAQASYSQMQDDAVLEGSPAKYVAATFGGLATDVGYDFAHAGLGLYNLATSSQARSRAVQTVGYVATHPGMVVDAAVTGVRDLWNKPFNEQAQSVFKGGLSGLAGAGIAKMAIAPLGIMGDAANGAATAQRGLWAITKEGTEQVLQNRQFGKFYKSSSDGLWWSKDLAGHGGSEWKVFQETSKGLEWHRDADKYGDFIVGKHKGDVGRLIPWDKLNGAGF